jgi:hypothetical protein
MGLTIHYTFLKEGSPEELLKKEEVIAKKLNFKIEKRSWNRLLINPHEDSEWIDLHFHKTKTIKRREGWDLEKDIIERKEIGDIDSDDWVCGGFVKTHYAGYEAHIKVAEFLRFIASYCQKLSIWDESHYYEKGYSEESVNELKEFMDDYNKGMSKLTATLKDVFGNGNIITGDEL